MSRTEMVNFIANVLNMTVAYKLMILNTWPENEVIFTYNIVKHGVESGRLVA